MAKAPRPITYYNTHTVKVGWVGMHCSCVSSTARCSQIGGVNDVCRKGTCEFRQWKDYGTNVERRPIAGDGGDQSRGVHPVRKNDKRL
jgi:hypothetical protein